MKKVLVFAPHSAIWVHAFPEALILESLQQSGYKIVYVTCGEQFEEYCISMSAFRVSIDASINQKKEVCEICNKNKNIIKRHFKFNGYDIKDFIGKDAKSEINKIIMSVNQGNYLDLIIDGIEVGRFALYNFLLEKKKFSLDIGPEEWSHYLIELRNTLFSFYANRSILKMEKPDFIIVYNPNYPVNRMAYELAEKNGVTAYYLHAGGNLSNRLETMQLGRGKPFDFARSTLSHWESWKDVPCNQRSLASVTDHFLELFRGFNVFAYSTPKTQNALNIYDFYNIEPHQKILVATLSSYDERLAAEAVKVIPISSNTFETQIDWIKALIDYITIRKDLFLLIRVHPREFPNKRESVQSEHSIKMKNLLSYLPCNAKVNWPSDNVSLYDLAENSDVFLNAWSSAGKEMSLLGLPVVIYSDNWRAYPSELNYLGTTPESYFSQIEKALDDGWSFEKVRMTYRWYVHDYQRAVISLSESYRMRESSSLRFWERVNNKGMSLLFTQHYKKEWETTHRAKELVDKSIIAEVFDKKLQSILDINKANKNHYPPVTHEQETKYLIFELNRLSQALHRVHDPKNQSKLSVHFSSIINMVATPRKDS